MTPNAYWPNKPISEIAHEIEAKYQNYKRWGDTSGYFDRVLTLYRAFYGIDSEGTLSVKRNDKGVAEINVSHLKSLLRRLHILVTENKLAFQPRAKSSDTKSQIEADLARGICEYYGDEKDMNGVLSDAVLGALIQLERWVHCPWDFAEGYELAIGGELMQSGDQAFETYGPLDVARNTIGTESNWFIIRRKVNKYDQAALYPDFADHILRSSAAPDEYDLKLGYAVERLDGADDEDHCYKYILYHNRTPAMPDGRHVEVIAGQVVADSKLKYEKVPLFRITAGDVIDTCFADSPGIDLLPLQEALNALFSGTITNNLNNCVQLLYSSDPGLTTRKLSDGQTLVVAAAPPQALNLTGSASENFKMIDMLVNHQQLLSGVNEVARGNPSANLKSGTSLAVVLAQAIQYVSNLQKNYAYLASEVASCLVDNIKQFATEEMTAYIVGSSKKGQIKKFKAQDLMNVERITVDLGNPLTQSLAGRQEMVTNWTQQGIIKNPKQIINFLSSGNLDQEIEDDFSDSILIRDENEMIKRGEKPQALMLDTHMEHILKHKAIFSSPEARMDPQLVQIGLAHIQEHIDLMRNVPPDLAAVLSGQPLPPPPGAVPPNQGPPQVNGANMPPLPEGAPPQTQDSYQQALDAVPPEQPEQF